MSIRAAFLILFGTAILAASASCSGSTEPTATTRPTLPARPMELRLDGITDVCHMLTLSQHEQLKVSNGSTDQGAYQYGFNIGPGCGWPGRTLSPMVTYGARLVLNHGAAASQGAEQPRVVGGFAAVLTAAPGFDPTYHCDLMIDVAPDQTLMAGFDNPTKDFPGMNRQLACDRAQQLADMLLTNLRTRLGR
jgi:hypothetical protein